MGSSGSGLISAGVVHRHLDVASPGFGAKTLLPSFCLSISGIRRAQRSRHIH